MIYLAIFVYLGALALYHDFSRARGGRNANYVLAYVVLVLLAGLRYKVGGDTYNYMLMHEFMPDLVDLPSTDLGIAKLQPLWLLFSACAKSISEEFFVLQIMHAVVVNGIIFAHISRNTRYRFTGILFYYFAFYGYFNFEILRESLAICCFLLAIKHYNAARWGAYYLLVSLAFLFHFSAVILFLLPLFRRINPRPLFIVVVFAVSALLNPYWMAFVGAGVASSWLVVAGEYVEYKYTLWGLLSLLLVHVAYPGTLIHVAAKRLRVESPYFDLARTALLVGALTPLFFIFFRFLNYFSLPLLMLAVEILHKIPHDRRTVRIAAVATPVLFVFFFGFYTARIFTDTSRLVPESRWYSYWYPYYSIFDEATDPTREKLIEATRSY